MLKPPSVRSGGSPSRGAPGHGSSPPGGVGGYGEYYPGQGGGGPPPPDAIFTTVHRMGTRPRVRGFRELERSKTQLTNLHTPVNRLLPGITTHCPRPSGAGEEAAGRAGWGPTDRSLLVAPCGAGCVIHLHHGPPPCRPIPWNKPGPAPTSAGARMKTRTRTGFQQTPRI